LVGAFVLLTPAFILARAKCCGKLLSTCRHFCTLPRKTAGFWTLDGHLTVNHAPLNFVWFLRLRVCIADRLFTTVALGGKQTVMVAWWLWFGYERLRRAARGIRFGQRSPRPFVCVFRAFCLTTCRRYCFSPSLHRANVCTDPRHSRCSSRCVPRYAVTTTVVAHAERARYRGSSRSAQDDQRTAMICNEQFGSTCAVKTANAFCFLATERNGSRFNARLPSLPSRCL